MIPLEVMRQIRRIQIRTSRMVNEFLAGQYESVFKGQGMEFKEVRAYVPGDDVRLIDWNVTARTGDPHVKIMAEERELTVMLLVDMSGSGRFGSVSRFKNELAAELCAKDPAAACDLARQARPWKRFPSGGQGADGPLGPPLRGTKPET